MLRKSIGFIQGRAEVLWEIILGRLGFRVDFVGYEVLLDYIERKSLWALPGDLLEIGAFMGGGTRKLANAARLHNKRVIVVDIFDPEYDKTENERGEQMAWIYTSILGQRSLRQEFNKNTNDIPNIILYAQDSRSVEFPATQELAFSFIDGSHSAEVVKRDFSLAWKHTVRGGVVALHDYGGDLPVVTHAIDEMRMVVRQEITCEEMLEEKKLIFLTKGV